jgi:hypothetical protein
VGNITKYIKKKERKMMKKLMLMMLALLLAGGSALYAANPGDLTLTVSVGGSLSVAVPRATYNFGALGSNEASVAAESTAVINDSTGLTERYSLKASDALGATPWDLVTAGSEAGDAYSLCAQFNSSRPADFSAVAFEMENGAVPCDDTEFKGADQSGYNITAGTEELLWFRINTPTSVTETGVHTIYVTITAVAMP